MIYGELLEFLYEKGLNEPEFLQETAGCSWNLFDNGGCDIGK